MYKQLFTLAAAGIISTQAFAVPIYDTFGPLPEATFGGTGIPNDEVAVSKQFVDGDVTITVAMSATQRFDNPALTNDGAGTYFATPGSSIEGQNNLEGALWNFNYYMKVEGANGAIPVLADYQIDLFYDFDTGLDTPLGSLGVWNITSSLPYIAPSGATLHEDSQNLMFGFLATSNPGFIAPPSGSFDPNALGEYTFAIQVSRAGFSVETVAMDVQVVPEPTSLTLLGFAGIGLMARRRRG